MRDLKRISIPLVLLLVASSVKCDDAAAAAAATSATSTGTDASKGVPPHLPPQPPVGIPGLGGLGFNKHLDFNAGFGPWLGGLGGLGGGIPPPEGGAGFGIPGLGLGGGGGSPFGLLGPSYIPSTWIGSALGAKGDLLFPLVIFVFFIVGLWTIVQFLLGLIVPLIAAKMSILKGGFDRNEKKFRRALTPQEDKDEQISHLTNTVWAAFENFGCMKTSACYTGNMVHSLAGKDKMKQYDSILDTMKIMDKDIVAIFKKAVESGKEDCTKYPCQAFEKKKGESHGQGDNHV